MYSHSENARAKRYLVEKPLWELLEALGAHEALLVVKLTVTVHYLLGRGEATLAALAHGVRKSVGHVAGRKKNKTCPDKHQRTLRYGKQCSGIKQGLQYSQNRINPTQNNETEFMITSNVKVA